MCGPRIPPPIRPLQGSCKLEVEFGGALMCGPRIPPLCPLQGSFKLAVEKGGFTDSEIIVMLGENGTGKTTFIRMLAGEALLEF